MAVALLAVPVGHDLARRKVADPVVFHDDDGERKVDVALEGAAYAAHAARAVTEEDGEELHLAYVALTRARH
jgi:ATP-dependent exoDNAse (exonuclease V) beta subunit